MDENKVTLVDNEERVKHMEVTYEAVKRFTEGQDVSIKKERDATFVGMGCVSVEGKEVVVTNPRSFVDATMLASGFEIYPKTNGAVYMDFTFHGLAKKGEQQ